MRIEVFDLHGRMAARLHDETLDAGAHAVAFDGSDLPSGTYLYRLTAGAFTKAGTMTLLK